MSDYSRNVSKPGVPFLVLGDVLSGNADPHFGQGRPEVLQADSSDI